MTTSEDLRPKGTVEVKCCRPRCEWYFWVDAIDPRLPSGPFVCPMCSGEIPDARPKSGDLD